MSNRKRSEDFTTRHRHDRAQLMLQHLEDRTVLTLFAPAMNFAIGDDPWAVAVGDFDGDGATDIAALLNSTSASLNVLLGDGNGGFSNSPDTTFSVGFDVRSLIAADFNGDGMTDIAAPIYFGAPGHGIRVFLATGGGHFTEASGSPFPIPHFSEFIAIGDFNNDSSVDLAVTSNEGSEFTNTVTVLLGNGLGGFPDNRTFMSVLSPYTLRAADFDADGNLDLVVTQRLATTLNVHFGDGQGNFGTPVTSSVNASSYLSVGDFNNDSMPDIVIAGNEVLLGDGAGRFARAPDGLFGDTGGGVLIGDFDADGNDDFASIGGSILHAYLGSGDASFISADGSPYSVGQNVHSVASGDFNGDGMLDLVTANLASDSVSVLINTSNLAPIADPDHAVTNENTPVLINVLETDSDPDEDPLTLSIVGDPMHGTAVVDDNNSPADPSDDHILYTPAPVFVGTDTFVYQVDDGRGGTATATVTVTVFGARTQIVLDFGGQEIEATMMRALHWPTDVPNVDAASFAYLFETFGTTLLDWADYSGDLLVNSADATLASDLVAQKVRQHFSPYNVDVIVRDDSLRIFDAARAAPTGADYRDTVVVVTGNTLPGILGEPGSLFGIAGGAEDEIRSFSNRHDDIAFGFAGEIALQLPLLAISDAIVKRAAFANIVAWTVSHEAGHTFGLAHVIPHGGSDVESLGHELMGSPIENVEPDHRDFLHEFNFQDIAYPLGDVEGDPQSSHQRLTQNLGASTRPWAAVLDSGTLTIMGSKKADALTVVHNGSDQWTIDIDDRLGEQNATLDPDIYPSIPNFISINPFDTPIQEIVIHSLDGKDRIEIDEVIDVGSTISAGDGHDTVLGGGGNDHVFGGNDNDLLFGRAGNDHLNGDAGRNILYGGDGNDHLRGGDDRDILIGGIGTDMLRGYGGDDLMISGDFMPNTSFDERRIALLYMLQQWSAELDYQTRVNNLSSYVLERSIDDTSVDQLFGDDGRDWYLVNLGGRFRDHIHGWEPGERIDDL